MVNITVNFPGKSVTFTSWYENIVHQRVKISNTISVIYITELKNIIPGHYGVAFKGDKNMEMLNNYYDAIFKNDYFSHIISNYLFII